MTHDELLAELDELDHSCSVVGITVAALLAVVRLHKPEHSIRGYRCKLDDLYPCPTIQAIEKELS